MTMPCQCRQGFERFSVGRRIMARRVPGLLRPRPRELRSSLRGSRTALRSDVLEKNVTFGWVVFTLLNENVNKK